MRPRYIYRNKLDKVGFQYDMAYGDFKDVLRRRATDKILRDTKLVIQSMMDINTDLYQWFAIF